jgi:predicted amidohydrolase
MKERIIKMNADYIIQNGRVIDPATNTDEIRDLIICNNKIKDSHDGSFISDHVINAEGCIVVPGLVDFHTHIYYEGSGIGIKPDMMIAQGTTAAVDAGTAGSSNFGSFYESVVTHSLVKIKSFLTVYSGGQLDSKLCEDFNPNLYNYERMLRVVDKYHDNILGLKIRISKGVVPDNKAKDYLNAAINLSEKINAQLGTKLTLCVHTTNSPITASELASCLRPGDIFCHCFQGNGNNIILGDGYIAPGILEARKRGVLFDAANGKGNFGLATAKRALEQGFIPDIISSDLTNDKFNIPPYDKNFLTILSKYLTLGLDLMTLLKTATSTPAKLMGLEGQIGTLKPGSIADVAILKLKNVNLIHKDWKDDELHAKQLLVPQMTICNGEIQFCQNDFWL